MTQPTEEAAKLARECAEASYRRWNIDAVIDVDAVEKDVRPILAKHLAAKDAEIAREIDRTNAHTFHILALENSLREANAEIERLRVEAEALVDMLDQDVALPNIFDAIDVDLRAALQPQEPTNEQ
jgi:hypothetical protein